MIFDGRLKKVKIVYVFDCCADTNDGFALLSSDLLKTALEVAIN